MVHLGPGLGSMAVLTCLHRGRRQQAPQSVTLKHFLMNVKRYENYLRQDRRAPFQVQFLTVALGPSVCIVRSQTTIWCHTSAANDGSLRLWAGSCRPGRQTVSFYLRRVDVGEESGWEPQGSDLRFCVNLWCVCFFAFWSCARLTFEARRVRQLLTFDHLCVGLPALP